MQDLIGDWHDSVMLAELAGEVLGDSLVHSAVMNRRDAKYDEAVSAVELTESELLPEKCCPGKKKPQRQNRPGVASQIAS